MSDEQTPEVPASGRERWKLIWRQGAEYSAEAEHGLDVIKLRLDGELRFENRKAGQRQACTARVDAEQVQAWIDAVRESGFPKVPDPQVAPGADLAALEVIGPYGANQVHFRLSQAAGWPGYAWMAATAARWADWLRTPKEPNAPRPNGLSDVEGAD